MMKAQGPAESASHIHQGVLTPRLKALLGSIWVIVHVLIPLRYYLWPGRDRYDERFSWRMFSAVRVERCRVKAWVEDHKGERLINLPKLLPVPWVSLVERNRPAVHAELLRRLCGEESRPLRARLESECIEPDGEPAPLIERSIECQTLSISTNLHSPPKPKG